MANLLGEIVYVNNPPASILLSLHGIMAPRNQTIR